jgi:hypothetical protein
MSSREFASPSSCLKSLHSAITLAITVPPYTLRSLQIISQFQVTSALLSIKNASLDLGGCGQCHLSELFQVIARRSISMKIMGSTESLTILPPSIIWLLKRQQFASKIAKKDML